METWKLVNEKYEVSTVGNVRRIGKDENINLCANNAGYFTVYIGKHVLVHRLVAMTFIPNPFTKILEAAIAGIFTLAMAVLFYISATKGEDK